MEVTPDVSQVKVEKHQETKVVEDLFVGWVCRVLLSGSVVLTCVCLLNRSVECLESL